MECADAPALVLLLPGDCFFSAGNPTCATIMGIASITQRWLVPRGLSSVSIRSAPFGQGLPSGRYPEPLFWRAVARPPLLLTTSDFDAGRAPRLRAGFSGCLLRSRCLRTDACLQRPRVEREHALGRLQFAEPARKLFALSIDARQRLTDPPLFFSANATNTGRIKCKSQGSRRRAIAFDRATC